MKISIIIPVYNVAPYVARCLDSVIAQTYPELECIIVDDCGTDNSMQIVRDKLEHYSGPIEFKIITHEKNRGLSAARNSGTAVATGEYVYYLDSDDLILPDTVALLVKPVENERLDFVIGNYAAGGEDSGTISLRLSYEISHSNKEILTTYLAGQWYMMAWNKLVSREFLFKNNLEFPEGIIHEDELWSFELACFAGSMGVVNSLTYVYCLRQNSIIRNPSRKKLDSWIYIVEKAESFVLEKDLLGDTNVCRLLTYWKEQLAYRAMPYGGKVAFDVYRKHVRKPSIFRNPQANLSAINRFLYLHHLFPPALGYFHYAIVFRAFRRMITLTRMLRV